jgi:hypothetical protein
MQHYGEGQTLAGQASTWPTPCTTDAAAAARQTTTTGVMHDGVTLTDAMRAFDSHLGHPSWMRGHVGPSPAVLCPEFVEALMGLPRGWSELDAADAFDALAMGLCPDKQQRLF